MDLKRVYRDLLEEKPSILEKYKLSRFYNKLDLSDYCKKFYPDYYYRVINVLDLLGERTSYYGHSKMLDAEKNRFYKLMGL